MTRHPLLTALVEDTLRRYPGAIVTRTETEFDRSHLTHPLRLSVRVELPGEIRSITVEKRA